jgi:hypothetical protein
MECAHIPNNDTIRNVWVQQFEYFHDVCLHAIPCCTNGQLHCGHSNDIVWMVHNLNVWLMDATNAMSSPSRHNKTLKFGIFWALNTTEATY